MQGREDVPKVKVYSTPSCPYCSQAKAFLKEHSIKYENINVAEDKQKAKEMVEKSGQMGVPVIEVNGKVIIGFNKDALKKALKLG